MALSNEMLRGVYFQSDAALRPGNDNRPSAFANRALPRHEPWSPRRIEVDLPSMTTRLEAESGILWATMQHQERACYTPDLVQDSRDYQLFLKEQLDGLDRLDMPFRYLVWRSSSKGAFSLGGDLAFFTRCVRTQDEAALRAYAYRCIEVLYDNWNALDLPILTVALVSGDAIGGGMESMLTNDLVIAERGAKFGLPEILFNLFPGMGGYSFLMRKCGEKTARALIEDGRSRSAEEMKELGLVDIVCEPGQAEAALRTWHAENDGRFNTVRTLRRAAKRVQPLDRTELLEIVDMWIELAMGLADNDLKRMDCLARVQEKKRARG